jgi:hypothetical protein
MAKEIITDQAVLENFSINFNTALDNAEVPPLHRGRGKWVAETFGVSHTAARKWCSGANLPSVAILMKMAVTFNVTVDALLYKDVKPQGKKTGGRSVSAVIGIAKKKTGEADQFQQLSTVMFEAPWLLKAMTINPLGLFLMVVDGDYMAPNLNHGDTIFIDTILDQWVDNGIYVLQFKKRIFIRRLSIQDDDSINLVCDNTKYPVRHHTGEVIIDSTPITKPHSKREFAPDSLVILGKVQWSLKRVAEPDLPNNLVKL